MNEPEGVDPQTRSERWAVSGRERSPSRRGEHETGDMAPEEFRKYGHEIVDWIADYLANGERYPVLSRVKPGEVKGGLPARPPEQGEPVERVLADFERIVMPGITHWNHPSFFAYFAITGSAPGILGELLSAALNVNGMLWKTSPSVTELEESTLDWLRQMLGLPAGFHGIIMDTASMASLVALAAAREGRSLSPLLRGDSGAPVGADLVSARGPEQAPPPLDIRRRGMAGRPDLPRLRVYTSEQAHSSIEKAAIVLGIGQEGVRKIETDAEFRLDPAALARALAEDRRDGWLPIAVVATVGTTSTTSVDPVPAIAAICREHGLWLHIDGAYAGMAAIVPEYRHVLAGCEHADSIVVNPHKWLFTPIDCSAFFVRDPAVLRRAFSLVPDYLQTNDDAVTNYMDWGPQLGRRFRALKLWFVIRYFGVAGLAARLREHIRLARLFAGWIDASPDFERLAPAPFSTVCFRANPRAWRSTTARPPTTTPSPDLDTLNERLLEAVNATGQAYLSHTRLRGAFTLRLAIGNLRTTEAHVARAWRLLREQLAELTAGC